MALRTTLRRWFPQRRRRVLGSLLVAALVIALLPWAWVRWTARGAVDDVDHAASIPVALVLGAGLTASGTPTPFLAARLDVAAQLHHSGKAVVIMVSGDNSTTSYDEPTAMFDYLVGRGVPEGDIVRDYAGRDTYDSCSRALRIFGVKRLALVSQGYHLPRAVATCRALGVEATGVGDWSMEEAYRPLWWSYSLREVPACAKTVRDLVTGRDPILGERESSVSEALARHGLAP